MLNFTDVTLRRGGRALFEQATFTIHQGEKVGITGANGVGKSSLFALLRGELQPDAGALAMPPGLVIAHVAQETPATDRLAIEYVIDGDGELRTLQAALAEAERAGDGLNQAALHGRIETAGGYTARSRAARLLHGLGFAAEQEETPVREFSGGWRMRLNLAQALMCRSDVLLLDEPTNHLDLDAVIWLQEWLSAYPGTLLLISHDRDFLDVVTGRIAHLERQRVECYTGNYSSFEAQRAEKLAQQQAAYARQQREIAHIRSFVDRFRAKATKARQAQSRLKTLERMELIARAHVDSPFDFAFRNPEKLPNPLLRLDQATLGYGGSEILREVKFDLAPGDRIGLLGPNGAGKSTLIKALAGELAPLSGRRDSARDLKTGYFAQHRMEQLRLDESPLRHLQRLDPKVTEKDLRNFLGGFDFRGDTVLEPVALFSGGEKARLVLALLVYAQPNLLLLDEPTNHLDLEMRHALGLALQDYEGAMVVVSHDRHLLRTVTDRLLLVADGTVQPFDGDLEDYRLWLTVRRSNQDADPLPEAAISRKDQRRREAERRQRIKPMQEALMKAEAQVVHLQVERVRLEAQLGEPSLYEAQAKERLKRLLMEKAALDQRMEAAEEAWIEAEQRLEEAEKSDENVC